MKANRIVLIDSMKKKNDKSKADMELAKRDRKVLEKAFDKLYAAWKQDGGKEITYDTLCDMIK